MSNKNNTSNLSKHISFSVVIPVYQGMPYAKIAIEAALNQIGVEHNVIVLNNGNCPLLHSYVCHLDNQKLVYLNFEETLPIEENWQRIVGLELNDYMTVIGHDDELSTNFLKTIENEIHRNSNYVLYGTQGNFIYSDRKIVRKMDLFVGKYSQSDYISRRFNFKLDVSGTGLVFKSNDFISNGGLPVFPNLLFSDDAFWLSLLKNGNGYNSSETNFSVMIHDDSESSSSPELGFKLLEAIEHFNFFLNYNIDNSSSEAFQQLKNKFIRKYFFRAGVLALLSNHDDRNVLQLLKDKSQKALSSRNTFLMIKFYLFCIFKNVMSPIVKPSAQLEFLKSVKQLLNRIRL